MSAPLELPFAAWPEPRRRAWERCTAPSDSLYDDGAAAARLRPRTILSRRRDYGYWLAFLARQGWLNAVGCPLAEVTPERLDAYVAEQQRRGVNNGSIRKRLEGLKAALQLMHPDAELDFIIRPHGVSLAKALPHQPRRVEVRDTAELFARALELGRMAQRGGSYAEGHTALRDALLLAILACRAPRIGSLAQMELGRHLIAGPHGYTVWFGERNLKTGEPVTYPLPAELTPLASAYLHQARPALGGDASPMLWISTHRGPLSIISMTKAVRRWTRTWFGRPYGPHWFRKCLATTTALRAPELVLDAAVVLGHGPEVSRQHYNMATAVEAAQRHDDRVSRLKRETALRAARLFAERADRRGQEQAARVGQPEETAAP